MGNGEDCQGEYQVKEVCESNGIEEEHARAFTLHPNPTSNGTISITLDNPDNLCLACFNTFGQQIHQQEIRSQETVVNVTTWTPGIYLAVVHADGKPVGRAKFVVR